MLRAFFVTIIQHSRASLLRCRKGFSYAVG
jgi:hypothetical protein